MGWLITLGILTALAVLPLGIRLKYDSEGVLARLILGPVKLTVYPLPKKQGKSEKPKEKAEDKPAPKAEELELPRPPQPPKPEKSKEKPKEKGGSLTDFLPFVKLALAFLGDFRRKLRLNNLELKLILASSDPCDLAVNYGRTWAAVGNLIPVLEKLFVIKKRNIEAECDFTVSETTVMARADVTITLGRLLALAVNYGIRAVKEFLDFKKKRKGGAEL